MKKILLLVSAVILFVSIQIALPTKTSASTLSAFEASKIVFNEHFMTTNHLKTDHSDSHYMRLGIDLAFLSVYTSQAKNKDSNEYSNALIRLNDSINTLYTNVNTNSTNYANNAFQDPGTSNILIGAILVKKFNMSDLTSEQQKKVNYLYDQTKTWLNDTYNKKNVNNTTYTFKKAIENQYKNENGDAPFALNILALYGAALALDSDFLFKKYGVNSPTDYTYRNDIANIGNYIKAVNFGDYSQGRLSNVGSNRNYVDVGYVTWHAKSLALIAHGTVYTQYFATKPNSVFMTEAEAISTGLQTVRSKYGYMPQEFYSLGTSVKSTNNVSQWLYSLTWIGKQDTVNWIDNINRPTGTYKGPVIAYTARQNTQALHRAIEGLTGAMLKGLSFNQ